MSEKDFMINFEAVRRAWQDTAESIVPLYQLPPQVKVEIEGYFMDIVTRRALGDMSMPEHLPPIDIEVTVKEDECQ